MSGRSLSRRTAVGSALVAPLVLAACDIDPPARDASPASPPPPEDAELVASVVVELVRAEGVLAAAAAAGLTAPLTPLAAAHAAHRELLVGAVADTALPDTSPARVPDAPDRALVVVRRSEQRLLRQLREACAGAASGDLARVLASVAASTAQHSAALGSGTTP